MYNNHKQLGHLTINLQAKKYIYPVFWLESKDYIQINAWFQICTMTIISLDTYQQIYKQKNIYTPVFDLSHSTIYKSTPDFKYVHWSYTVRTPINKYKSKKIYIPRFFTWVIVLSTNQRLISNMFNDHKQLGHISTNIQAKIYIYPRFWLESQCYLQINAWFKICTMNVNSQDIYQQIYKQKNIYTPVFDLSHSIIYRSTPDFRYVQWS